MNRRSDPFAALLGGGRGHDDSGVRLLIDDTGGRVRVTVCFSGGETAAGAGESVEDALRDALGAWQGDLPAPVHAFTVEEAVVYCEMFADRQPLR